MLDSCVEWLAAQGRTGQCGAEPLSEHQNTVESVGRYVDEGDTCIAEVDGVPAATLTLTDAPGAGVAAPVHV